MKATVGILSLLTIVALAGCSSDDGPTASGPMPVRLNVQTNPVGCSSSVYWTSAPDGMNGQMEGMTSPQATTPEMIDRGTMISVQGGISCAVPGSSGDVDVTVQIMVGGDWQDLPTDGGGAHSCAVNSGPGGCTFEFSSEVS